jgi:sensor histidine kinase YesM
MKPLFIYNGLHSIWAACDHSVDEAKRAIALFAQYLRTSLVDLDSHKLIPFEEEIKYVENYVEIEKIRFGDRLEVKYNIEATDFMVPPLCLQAIVENAVKHGIEKKIGGGTITISSVEDERNIIVTVADNGVGFSDEDAAQNERKNDKRKHVGIYAATHRLENLCGGKLEYNSKKGEGTTAIITIPRI